MLQPGQGKRMVEEATGWVGLTREHPVYRGGRENPKYLTNPPAEGDIKKKKNDAMLQRYKDHLHKYSEQ